MLNVPGATYDVNFWAANILRPAATEAKESYIGISVRNTSDATGTLYNSNESVTTWLLPRSSASSRTSPLPWQELGATFTLPYPSIDQTIYFNFYNSDPNSTNIRGNDLAIDDIAIRMRVVILSGSVYNDANGIKDANESMIDKDLANKKIYAYLTKPGNIIIGKAEVQPDGTYQLVDKSSVPYSVSDIGLGIYIRSDVYELNEVITNSNIDGFRVIAEPNSNVLDGGTESRDGYVSILNSSTSVTNVDFGINHTPVVEPIYELVDGVANTDDIVKIDNVDAPAFIGKDIEDQNVLGSLTGKKIYITSLPTNGEMLYKNQPVRFGRDGVNPPSESNPFEIANWSLNDLSIKLTGSGYTSTTFKYAYLDQTNILSKSEDYTIEWNTPLPIVLVSFTAQHTEAGNKLQWQIYEDAEVSHYEIEYANDGANWSSVAELSVKSEDEALKKYDYMHAIVTNGSAFYRLKIIDVLGKIKYSNVESVHSKATASTIVYPNPAKNTLHITSTSNIKTVQLVNLVGNVVYQNVMVSANTHLINIENICVGTYIVNIQLENGEETIEKVIIH